MTIYKYPILVHDVFDIKMPRAAKVLSVQVQRDTPVMWALVDPAEKQLQTRRFYVNGTGHPIEHRGQFIGTFQIAGGDLVFHLFQDAEGA